MRTYAFTDVHGRADLLGEALKWIASDSAGESIRLVGLGDYVDRGPDSLGVMQLVSRARETPGWDVVLLQGNHDRMMVDAVSGNPRMRDLWLMNGGLETLHSYGTDASDLTLLARHPHYDLLRRLPVLFEDEARIYVHAGLRPGLPLSSQTDYDLQWIREPFLSCDEDFGKIVVHGHTPVVGCEPDVRACRINLDTGACFSSGSLTIARWIDGSPDPFFRSFPGR